MLDSPTLTKSRHSHLVFEDPPPDIPADTQNRCWLDIWLQPRVDTAHTICGVWGLLLFL
jgi:hypothetical protein